MDNLKGWLLEQMKAEPEKSTRWWRLEKWLTRVSMAEFKSTELKYGGLASGINADGKQTVYEELVAPIKEEIKFWEKK